jgi:hypothetical protein
MAQDLPKPAELAQLRVSWGLGGKGKMLGELAVMVDHMQLAALAQSWDLGWRNPSS